MKSQCLRLNKNENCGGEEAMPLMAMSDWSDERSTTLLMAEEALACVKDTSKVSASKTVLNNMYRLLEAFRSNAFFGFEPEEPSTEHPDTHGRSIVFESHSSDVRTAI